MLHRLRWAGVGEIAFGILFLFYSQNSLKYHPTSRVLEQECDLSRVTSWLMREPAFDS